MSKVILVKLTKAGNRTITFKVVDNFGNILGDNISKEDIISGISYTIDDRVTVITLISIGKDCYLQSINISVSTITQPELAQVQFEPKNTGSLWRHLTDTTKYNYFYNSIHPYILEYPVSYGYHDEIVQDVKDYTKVYTYFQSNKGIFDINRKIQVNDKYFNKAILYNDQQSSGILNLVAKPTNNLKSYLQYPKLNSGSKDIIYTKSDKFYIFSSFWDIVKDHNEPLFISSCESLSIDKEVNQDNMIYTDQSFKKYKIRGADLKVRYILDNSSDFHLVSQFISQDSQLSYK